MNNNISLSAKDIYGILKEKDIKFLHHANTISTSITFIEQNALLSRAYVEENNLLQTEQKSDSEDKAYDVWDHVFLDGEDLHKRYNRANRYGPVLFRLNLELLTSPLIQSVFVTKSNPWYWKANTPLEQRFYSDTDSVKNDYLTGKRLDSQIMFTFRNPEKSIKLSKFLHSIGIDKPKLLINSKDWGKLSAGNYAEKVIKESLTKNKLGHIPVLARHNDKLTICRCHFDYNLMAKFKKEEFKKMFANISRAGAAH